jgi:hypothetical protein
VLPEQNADMEDSLLPLIDEALREIQPMVDASFEPAVSIARQLNWCRNHELGLSTQPRPGPFSMSLIAVREFDMYGDRPKLSALVNKVQRLVEAKLPKQ